MSNALQRYAHKAADIYSKKGIRGICSATFYKVKCDSLPLFYANRLLRNLYHPKLTTVFLELTNNCNLRCEMCNWQVGREKGYISKQLFESCIDQLSEMELDTLNLHGGGESLVHPNFKELLQYAIDKRDQGKIGCIGWTTNGMLFNQSIADLAVSLKVDWVNFSLDGVGEVNDKIRVGSKYSVIEKNIKYLLEKRGNETRPKVLINIVDHGKTEEQKMAFFKAWVPFVDEIEIIPSILPDNRWERNNSENLEVIHAPSFCSFALSSLVIWWDGTVSGCCFDTGLKIVLGDVTKESVKQIWNGPKSMNFRKALVTNSFPKDMPCYNCEFWKVNFEPKSESILDGKAMIDYGYIYRRVHRKNQHKVEQHLVK